MAVEVTLTITSSFLSGFGSWTSFTATSRMPSKYDCFHFAILSFFLTVYNMWGIYAASSRFNVFLNTLKRIFRCGITKFRRKDFGLIRGYPIFQ